jgi:hypothetical protein
MVTIRNAVRFNLFTEMSSFTQPAKSRIRQIDVSVGVRTCAVLDKCVLQRSKKAGTSTRASPVYAVKFWLDTEIQRV